MYQSAKLSRRGFLLGRTRESSEPSLQVSENCLIKRAIVCRSCGDACAERAIRFQTGVAGVAEIQFDPALCTGCGDCVAACPADAVRVAAGRGKRSPHG